MYVGVNVLQNRTDIKLPFTVNMVKNNQYHMNTGHRRLPHKLGNFTKNTFKFTKKTLILTFIDLESKEIRIAKFGRKIMYVDYLHKLKEHLHFDQLVVPSLVLEHDAKILAAQKPSYPYSSDESEAAVHNPKQQFGVKLQQILQNYKCVIPPVVEICVEFLRKNALDVEGIFRRSANASVLKDVQKRFNQGETVDFDEINDVHIPAVTMKTFLRDLQEPILTFDLYQPVVRLHTLEEDRQLIEVQRLFREELPKENYIILKYIIHFLTQVSQYSDSNKMNTLNLAIVFGPNLLWPKGQANLSTIGHLNSFAAYLIDNYTQLFVR
ncbi:Rho GTPase-activating protein 1,Rho GTPase-activating protein 8 [Mytilus coruscus]|uniref:Rho GTPase-activating protein 1,Rho GTPase-activating protein 8 n=1 Tax=Mytilus coruscus TaxID=42192 RepID=A0A6J8AR45_MYTCO|nr:Rho GTPase-activating protein 1,Rho GTPase-activating protein 8 [Mytilus coruscus]